MAIFQLFSSRQPRKRDGPWSWLVCACATMTWVASLGFLFSFGIFLPVFMNYFNESRETTAWLGSVGIALAFFTGHLSSALVTRFGCRVTTLIGGAFCVVSLITSSFVENMMVLFFTYSLLFGLGSSCTFSAGLVVIGKYFKKRQSLATGVLTAGHGGGVLVMGPTLEALVRITGSWQTTYRIMAGVAFILCSLAVTFDPNVESDEDDNDNQEKEERYGGDKAIEEGATKKQLIDFSVWKELPVIAIIVGACVVEFGHFVPQIHLIRYGEDLGISAEKGSKLFIYYGLCSAIGRLLAGIMCNNEKVNPFYVFQAAEFVAGLSTILVTLTTTYTPLVIYVIVYGLSDGFFFTSLSFILLTASPLKTPAVLGWEMMLTSAFLASGPPLVGLLADKLGSYVLPFQVAGGITLAGSFIPFMLLCDKRRGKAVSILEQEDGENLQGVA
ncbi:monocarboxylate transporter 10 [Pocillopora verrucosa]|uniref:monocarboxylate transporter 10 n=1 Tax=Pocillopora verrucosa TaxID=203993 RepID=UPI00333E9983